MNFTNALPLDATAPELATWLTENAESLDTTNDLAASVLPRLGNAGLFRIGIPAQWGGDDGSLTDAIEAIASVARYSLTAALVFWGQRTFIEYLLQSDNSSLQSRWLPALVAGDRAGASGLSNAMKYLSDMESLQMKANPLQGSDSRWMLNGQLPWITNLRREGAIAAAVFDTHDGQPPLIFAVPSDAAGVTRCDDLDLIALRASNTAALKLDGAELGAEWLISKNAPAFIAKVRPAFLGLQCGMMIGLARRALETVAMSSAMVRPTIDDDAMLLEQQLKALTHCMHQGIASCEFKANPAQQFEGRIELTAVVIAAVQLELQAIGGRGYLRKASDVARHTRECAFIPIVTPSIVQLKNELARHQILTCDRSRTIP